MENSTFKTLYLSNVNLKLPDEPRKCLLEFFRLGEVLWIIQNLQHFFDVIMKFVKCY